MTKPKNNEREQLEAERKRFEAREKKRREEWFSAEDKERIRKTKELIELGKQAVLR